MNDVRLFSVAERPGRGIYRCLERPSWVVSLTDAREPLPPCFGERRFQNVRYVKIVDFSTATLPQDVARGR